MKRIENISNWTKISEYCYRYFICKYCSEDDAGCLYDQCKMCGEHEEYQKNERKMGGYYKKMSEKIKRICDLCGQEMSFIKEKGYYEEN